MQRVQRPKSLHTGFSYAKATPFAQRAEQIRAFSTSGKMKALTALHLGKLMPTQGVVLTAAFHSPLDFGTPTASKLENKNNNKEQE